MPSGDSILSETTLQPCRRALGHGLVRTVPSPVVTIHRQSGHGAAGGPGYGSRPLDRRTLLRGGAGFGALALSGGLLSACGRDGTDTEFVGKAGPASRLIAAYPQEVPHAAAGIPTRLPFVLATADGTPMDRIDGNVRFTVAMDARPVGSAVEVAPRSVGVPQAYLPLTFEFPTPGLYDIFAEYRGERLDATLQVYEASRIGPPVVGEQLPPVDSPITVRTLDVDPLCTRVPACPFHEVNLQDVLGTGRPVVLLVASPAYCRTSVCAPMLDMLVELIGARTDVAVLHNEVYKNPKDVRDLQDAGLAPVPDAYKLRFDPVLFVTNAAGLIVSRADIMVDRSEMTELLALAR